MYSLNFEVHSQSTSEMCYLMQKIGSWQPNLDLVYLKKSPIWREIAISGKFDQHSNNKDKFKWVQKITPTMT